MGFQTIKPKARFIASGGYWQVKSQWASGFGVTFEQAMKSYERDLMVEIGLTKSNH